MRAAVYNAPGDVRVETVDDPGIEDPTDAIVRVEAAAICGSDLWSYRGISKGWKPGMRLGHEFLGTIEDVGSEVGVVRPGDLVLAPFYWLDGSCDYCRSGLTVSCENGGGWGGDHDGGQGEAVRVPFADATLVRLPGSARERLPSVLPVTDVLSTGHHAAVAAGVGPGSTVVVVGDGAVGLCAVLAARRLGAERIIAVGHHADRLERARDFGATDVAAGSDEDNVAAVQEITAGGATSVCECVGTQSSIDLSIEMVRDGGAIGYVGVPAGGADVDLRKIFGRNVTVAGGVATVRDYTDQLLPDVLEGRIDPAPVFDLEVDLDGVPKGYAAMSDREAIKVLVRP